MSPPFPVTRANTARSLTFPPAELIPPALVLHLARCCELPEAGLRSYVKSILGALGFTFQEDAYGNRTKRGIPNLLAVRGDPRVMLVAHSDTSWAQTRSSELPSPAVVQREGRWLMEDRERQVQLGGDDRLGIALMTWIAACDREAPLALLLTTDEEVGCLSADEVPGSWFEGIDLAVQVDRKSDGGDQLVTRIGGTKLCSDSTAEWLLGLAKEIGLPREEVVGGPTDVCVLIERGVCPEAVNLTCGYHRPHGKDEYVDLQEANDTLRFLQAIVTGWNGESVG